MKKDIAFRGDTLGLVLVFRISLIVLLTLTLPIHCYAGSRILASELVKLHELPKVFDNLISSCLDSNTMSALQIYDSNPKYYGGMTPQSKYWPEMEEVTENYWHDVCHYSNFDGMTEIYITHFQNEFTDSELIELIDFYSSRIGQKMINVGMAASFKLQESSQSAMNNQMTQASKNYLEKIQKIIDKNRKAISKR